jgi:GH24 family phage-related lysozyme (muramidase)
MRKLSIKNQKPIAEPIISTIFNSVNSLFPGFNLPTNMFQQRFPKVNFLANFSGDISKLDVSNLGKLKFEQTQNYEINPNSEYIIGTNTYDPRLIPNVTPDTRFTNPDHTLTTQTFSINPNANGKYTLYKADALKGYVPFYEFNIEQISKLSNNQNKKYREGGTTTDPKESISNNYEVNFENYIKFLEDEEASWSYVQNKNSAILKPDGKTYYKIFEGNKFYPYYHENSNGTFEKDATIGYGSKGSNVYDDYKNGMSFEDAKKLQLIDIEKHFKITEQFINNKYGTDKNTNPFNYLTNHEKFMLTDYTYNVGSLSKFPKFTDAIINKDFKAALNEYKRFDEKGGKELGRNKGYLINYLTPWVNFQKEKSKNEQEFIRRMKESLFNIPGFNEMDRGISGVNYIPH